MKSSPSVSLIINTFNQVEYLARVLAAVTRQSSLPDAVLLADDGSDAPTREYFSNWKANQRFHTAHFWQPHEGFRRSPILNQSIAAARADYVVFLDGDTMPHPKFIADHRATAQRGFFISGHRSLIREQASVWFGQKDFSAELRRAFFQNQICSLQNSFRWPFALRKIKTNLRGIRGCNLAIWRDDLVRVNGYDENFVGWGCEDFELGARLMNAGIQRRDLRGRALCFHLWHPPLSRASLSANDRLLKKTVREKKLRCELGLDRHD
jgi:GT2 family glycosyltransferase